MCITVQQLRRVSQLVYDSEWYKKLDQDHEERDESTTIQYYYLGGYNHGREEIDYEEDYG